jgi:hypothetical protein
LYQQKRVVVVRIRQEAGHRPYAGQALLINALENLIKIAAQLVE